MDLHGTRITQSHKTRACCQEKVRSTGGAASWASKLSTPTRQSLGENCFSLAGWPRSISIKSKVGRPQLSQRAEIYHPPFFFLYWQRSIPARCSIITPRARRRAGKKNSPPFWISDSFAHGAPHRNEFLHDASR